MVAFTGTNDTLKPPLKVLKAPVSAAPLSLKVPLQTGNLCAEVLREGGFQGCG